MTLPEGWAETTLGEVCHDIVDGSHNPPVARPVGKPMLSARNIQGRRIHFDQYRLIDASAFENEDRRTRISPGAVLLTIVGAIGRAAVVPEGLGAFTVQRSVGVLHANEGVSPHWLSQRFDAADSQRWFAENARGTAQKGVYLKTLSTFPLALPPLAEQRRIVAKLDALTARLARARAEVGRGLALAGRMRASALSACFASTEPKVRLGELLSGIEAGKNLRCEERPPREDENGVVKVSAVTWGRFDKAASKTLPADYRPPAVARIVKGDLLISRANTIELVGAAVLVEEDAPNLYLSDKVLRLVVPDVDKPWVLHFLRSPEGRRQIESASTGNQMSMRNISQAALRDLRLPMPEASVRRRRAEALDAAFARADRLEAEARKALALVDRLEAAILARAFRGELVPQDPADEPASVMLDRIRARRAAEPKAKRGRRAKQTA